jgi:hypothetical protein
LPRPVGDARSAFLRTGPRILRPLRVQ